MPRARHRSSSKQRPRSLRRRRARSPRCLAFAYAQLDKPYHFGGSGTRVFDCSGLTMRASLPRASLCALGRSTTTGRTTECPCRSSSLAIWCFGAAPPTTSAFTWAAADHRRTAHRHGRPDPVDLGSAEQRHPPLTHLPRQWPDGCRYASVVLQYFAVAFGLGALALLVRWFSQRTIRDAQFPAISISSCLVLAVVATSRSQPHHPGEPAQPRGVAAHRRAGQGRLPDADGLVARHRPRAWVREMGAPAASPSTRP